MNVYKKLMQARAQFHALPLKKSGKNEFAKFNYFELGDFLPAVQTIFSEVGLCGVVSYNTDYAYLRIYDTDAQSEPIVITSPMAALNLKAAHDIQNMGGIQTYQRRYLWMTAMEVVENDLIDAAPPKAKEPPEVKPKPPKEILGKPGGWQLSVGLNDDGDADSWVEAVMDLTKVALDMATNPTDVRDIFKVNRAIYDNLKVCDAEQHDAVLTMFRTAKSRFEG
jgi:hypothetical protein